MSAQFDTYVMGHTSKEYQRLRMQARAWEEATKRVLAKAGLASGARCLDAGCGPGEVMRLMREIVGPSGHVTGVDADGEVGRQALAALTSAYGGNIAFHTLDLASGAPIPNAPFDLVFARLVLFHQKDQGAFLQRLWGATKPGGVMLVMEYDIPAVATAWPEWSQPLLGFIIGTFRGAGIDPGIGRRLPELFVASGIGEADGVDASTLCTPAQHVAAMSVSVANSLLPAAERQGAMAASDLAKMIAAFEDSAASSPAWLYWPMMIATWKLKPVA